MTAGATAPLLPLDAAKALAEKEPTYSYSYFGSDCCDCLHCDGSQDSRKGYEFVHDADCPWLQAKQIVAALELASQLIGDIRAFIHWGASVDAMGVSASLLESALRGSPRLG